MPGDDISAASIGNSDFGTSPFFVQLSDKLRLERSADRTLFLAYMIHPKRSGRVPRMGLLGAHRGARCRLLALRGRSSRTRDRAGLFRKCG